MQPVVNYRYMDTNHGLLIAPYQSPKDYIFGAATVLAPEQLRLDGDWSAFLGVYEPQSFAWGDTMACVSYSALNCVEIIARYRTEKEYNYSDRFLAKVSGTTPTGNYLEKVAETIRTFGLVSETDWPVLSVSRDDYYKPIPVGIVANGADFLSMWDFGWEWVGASRITLLMALKTSPIQVTVKVGSPTNDKGYLVDGGSNAYAHAVTLYNATEEYYEIFDHYNNTYKKYDKSYTFGHAIRFFLKPKNYMPTTNPLNLVKNSLIYVRTSNSIKRSFFWDGRMVVGSPDAIEDAWFGRNTVTGANGVPMFEGAAVYTINEADWLKYPLVNFKGEKVDANGSVIS